LKVLEMAEALSPKYHVVVANPPYMGSAGMNPALIDFVESSYREGRFDLFSCFMMRVVTLVQNRGVFGIINMQSWMFLSTFEKLRVWMLSQSTFLTLIQIGYNTFPEMNSKVAQGVAFVSSRARSNFTGDYFNLNDAHQSAAKDEVFLLQKKDRALSVYNTKTSTFMEIPGCPIAYWLSKEMIKNFESGISVSDFAKPKLGMRTGDNARFLRFWHEVSGDQYFTAAKDRREAKESKRKWFPYNKGGEWRKWYGNNDLFVPLRLGRLRNLLGFHHAPAARPRASGRDAGGQLRHPARPLAGA
jgi:hypothetical protein